MPDHKFHIGQIVSYRPVGRGVDAPRGGYTVTALLPQGDEGQFEIIDACRKERNLSSAIRLFVLEVYKDQITPPQPKPKGGALKLAG